MTTRIHAILEKEMVREFLAEFLSTYVMMMFGLGSVAHMVVGDKFGSFLGVNLGFGFGVTMGVHVAGNISGAHMNAALTFTNCALGRMSWKKFPVYVLGQFMGSFLAAATIYCLFYQAIMDYSGGYLTVTGPTATANIFATYLPDHMTLWRGFLDERNNPALQGTQALVIGILVVVIGVSLGMNTGYAINPSRDLPPRFFTFLAGWGIQVFSNPWEAQMLENPGAYEDRRISVLPKTSSYPPNSSSLTPVSVSPTSRPSIRPVPPLGDSVNLEQF
ncbi:aquaporin-7 isoform X10 [Equus caballus]